MMEFKNIEGKVVDSVKEVNFDREFTIFFKDGSHIHIASRHDRYEDDYLDIEYLDATTKEVERN
jgi:hypothetical protein